MTFQLLILGLFVVLTIAHLIGDSQSLISLRPFTGDKGFPAIAAGAAVAAYSFLGFDAISTLTEETHDAERTIPRAIALIALIGGAIFITVAYLVSLVAPGSYFPDSDSLAEGVAKTIGGSLFGAIFLAALVVGQSTSGLAAQAAVSRLLYAMGRDGVLPKRVFGMVSEKFHTSVFNIALTGAVGLIAMFLSVAMSTSFVNFGAFTAFTLVNVSVVAYFLRHRGTRLPRLRYVALPVIGAAVNVYLLSRLDSAAIIVGSCWAGIGFLLLLWLTRGLTRNPPDLAGIAGRA
ncbi:MAG: APC family permease [Mycobacterium sp.]